MRGSRPEQPIHGRCALPETTASEPTTVRQPSTNGAAGETAAVAPGSMPRRAWVLVAVACGIATIAVILGAVAVAQERSDVSSLRKQVAAADARVAALKSTSVSGLQSSLASTQTTIGTLQAVVGHLHGAMNSLTLCVPQLQQEINGLTLNTNTQGGFLTGVNLNNPTIVSSNCNSTLYGQ